VTRVRWVAAVGMAGLAGLTGFSCRSRPGEPGVYGFSGEMRMKIANCTVANPPRPWTTTFRIARAGNSADHVLVTEVAYGCTVLAARRGQILDASGLSCPLKTAGFFRQEFSSFRWDLAAKKIEYSSTLSGHDANGTVVTYCADVTGVL